MGTSPTESAGRTLVERLRREPDDASSIPARLAAMLFLRWADFREAEAEAMAAFEDQEYAPLLPGSLHWRTWHNLPPAELPELFSKKLPDAIERLENAHDFLAASLRRILPVIQDLSRLTPRTLGILTEWLAAQAFETPNDRRRLLEEYDLILDHCGGREIGQHRTPAGISQLLVALAAPGPGERLYDPCFGSAGILTAAIDRLQTGIESRFIRPADATLEVFGVEINVPAYSIGLTRLVLAGGTEPQLELGNSLERENLSNPQRDGFDVVVCNPPWGGRLDPRGLDHYPVRTNDSTGLFVQHALSQLRPEGRAVIVVPWGFLFPAGKMQSLREWLLERHRVDAVVHLPEGVFLPYTAVKGAILLLRKDGGPTERVRMVEGESYFEPGPAKKSAQIAPSRVSELVAAVQERIPAEHAWDVEFAALKASGLDFGQSRPMQSGLERVLATLGNQVPISPLKDLCRIRSGTTVRAADLSPRPDKDEAMAYVRIGDLHWAEAGKVQTWVTSHAAEEMRKRRRLRAGEILLSRSGTIGKVGIIRNGAVGGIASNALFVLETIGDRIDPHYLSAYLRSDECRAWLEAQSTGSVIRSLRKQCVEELPVPVPPLAIQHRIAVESRGGQGSVDPLDMLLEILAEGANPLATWINSALEHLKGVRSPKLTDVLDAKVLGTAFEKAERGLAESDCGGWAAALAEARNVLQTGAHAEGGIRAFANLQVALRHLTRAAGLLWEPFSTVLQDRANKLTRSLISALETESDQMAGDARLSFNVEIQERLTPDLVDGSISVRNEGQLPLQALRIHSSPNWCRREFQELSPGATEYLSLSGTLPSEVECLSIHLDWTAKSLDGRTLQGSQELVIDPPPMDPHREELEQGCSEVMDLGHSPYFVSKPVGPDRDDVFFGRAALLERIKEQIQSRNTVLLEGNRRAGKSSILKHIEGVEQIPGWLAVYCSFQGGEGHKQATGMPTVAVWRTLAHSVAEGLRRLACEIPLPDGTTIKPNVVVGLAKACRAGISEEAPWDDFQEYLAAAMRVLHSRSLGLVLMIDEFDKLQEGIDNGVTSPQIPENIRYLIQNVPDFVAVLTGSRRMQRLRHEYWSALYGLGNRVGVTALDDASARQLITDPVRGRLAYSEEAVKYVVEVTARQPFLIQYLCNRIFEISRQASQRSVTLAAVKSAAAAFVEDNEHFASLWGYAETERRRFILALCHREAAGPDPFTFGVLQERMATAGLQVRDAELAKDLDFLKELELIDFRGKGSGSVYRLTIPLMGQWLDAQHDFDATLARALAEQEAHL